MQAKQRSGREYCMLMAPRTIARSREYCMHLPGPRIDNCAAWARLSALQQADAVGQLRLRLRERGTVPGGPVALPSVLNVEVHWYVLLAQQRARSRGLFSE